MAREERRAERIARNQALIREVNERIEQMLEDAAHPEFLCECGDENCIQTLQLSIAEYESIRSAPNRFPITPGHEFPEVELVVEENERYAVVEKTGEAGEVARETDPRS